VLVIQVDQGCTCKITESFEHIDKDGGGEINEADFVNEQAIGWASDDQA
jgi:hypothetical protein